VISHRHRVHTFADGFHHARSFVTRDDGHGHGEIAAHDMVVTVTDASGFHAHGHFSPLGWQHLYLLHAERFTSFIQDCG
jgi:hypothetical protein